jgi:hypothetical protein
LILAYTYQDAEGGLSARGREVPDDPGPNPDQVARLIAEPDVTVRVWPECPVAPLSDTEVGRLGLPDRPPWLRESAGGTIRASPWRLDPEMHGRFHPRFPDDVTALFFLRETGQLERMWVRLTGTDEEVGGYWGELLNTATGGAPAAGERVCVRLTPGLDDPLYVDAVTRANLTEWAGQCAKCGFDLVMLDVRQMQRQQYPDMPPEALRLAFSSRCAACGNGMLVRPRTAETSA